MLELLGATLIVGACGALGLAARQRLTLRIAALTAMLEAEHFDVLERWGGYNREPVTPQTQRMVYVTRRQ